MGMVWRLPSSEATFIASRGGSGFRHHSQAPGGLLLLEIRAFLESRAPKGLQGLGAPKGPLVSWVLRGSRGHPDLRARRDRPALRGLKASQAPRVTMEHRSYSRALFRQPASSRIPQSWGTPTSLGRTSGSTVSRGGSMRALSHRDPRVTRAIRGLSARPDLRAVTALGVPTAPRGYPAPRGTRGHRASGAPLVSAGLRGLWGLRGQRGRVRVRARSLAGESSCLMSGRQFGGRALAVRHIFLV